MSARFHLQLAGALMLALSVAHIFFWRYFRWGSELASVSLLTRQVFGVHTFFIALVLAIFGELSLWETDALLDQGSLDRSFLASMLFFWLCRLGCQWLVYDSEIWRRRPLYTRRMSFSRRCGDTWRLRMLLRCGRRRREGPLAAGS
jgi:hypothetical protein